MFASKDALFAKSSSSYTISRSLRFRSSASAYLSRTPASAGNQKTWTYSTWVKLGNLTAGNGILSTAGAGGFLFYFTSSNTFRLDSSGVGYIESSAVFRDPSSWYHIVLAFDTTQATSTNRFKLYVNGVQQTLNFVSFTPALNTNYSVNSTVAHYISNYAVSPGSYYLDGYLAEVNFIDGQALTPSSFGAFDTNGVWQPARYTGSYTGNSFYLPFTNSSAIGTDSSGLGNNWTASGTNTTTTGVTYDWMLDSSTNYADGGNGRGNYATVNPLQTIRQNSGTYTNGNLTVTGQTAGNVCYGLSTIGVTSGKWYFEATVTSNGGYGELYTGLFDPIANGFIGGYLEAGTGAPTYTSYGTYACAFDADAGKIWFRNSSGTWVSGDPAAGTSPSNTFTGGSVVCYPVIAAARSTGSNNPGICDANFGQRPFTYTPPSGFSALNTQNLPTPTIANGAQYMAAYLWASTDAASRALTGLGFKPDFLWAKARNAAGVSHRLYDAVRGATTGSLVTDTAAVEDTATGQLTSFDTDGFTTGTVKDYLNFGTRTYVGWAWNAGGSTVTGYQPSGATVACNVRANVTAGFSVITFTAPASGGFTVGHGLGVTPGMIIAKDRDNAYSWAVWHQNLSNTAQSYLALNGTGATTSNTTIWNNTAPTSSVVSMGVGGIMGASAKTVLYCFANVAGYSSAFSFSGNGSSDGPMVYLSFRPRYLFIKRTDSAGTSWWQLDSSCNPYNVTSGGLTLNTSDAESSGNTWCDFLSNGFKIRTSSVGVNASGGTYIGFAFAENPFKTSRAR